MVLDTDSVFHGVERVADVAASDLPPLRPGMSLDFAGGDTWIVHDAESREIIRYQWHDLRFSVSWKAYCFADESERDAWRNHSADLDLETALDALIADLEQRENPAARGPRREVGSALIDEYVVFPAG